MFLKFCRTIAGWFLACNFFFSRMLWCLTQPANFSIWAGPITFLMFQQPTRLRSGTLKIFKKFCQRLVVCTLPGAGFLSGERAGWSGPGPGECPQTRGMTIWQKGEEIFIRCCGSESALIFLDSNQNNWIKLRTGQNSEPLEFLQYLNSFANYERKKNFYL